MKVKFRRSALFNETLAKHKEVAGRLQEFIRQKSEDPMSRFGAKDQHFSSSGILQQTGLIHAHLTHDISILYKRHSKDPIIIDLYAILTHDELGTGQPPNLKQQKKMVKQLSSQEF